MPDYEFQIHPPWFLLPDAALIDIPELFWNLEKTVEANPSKWGWIDRVCSVCGNTGAVLWSQETGYRCEDHRT